MDDDSGRVDVVGEVASFVRGEEIDVATGDDGAKIGNQYVVQAGKAIQGYFRPDSTQYAQVGGTRQSDRKTGGRRAKIATLPQAAVRRDDRGRLRSSQTLVPAVPADAMSATAGAWARDGRQRSTWSSLAHAAGPTADQHPTVAQDGRCRAGVSFRRVVSS
jgi:hypothetical protein